MLVNRTRIIAMKLFMVVLVVTGATDAQRVKNAASVEQAGNSGGVRMIRAEAVR